MSTFRQAPAPAKRMLEAVKAELHEDLVEAGVTVGLLFAHAPRDKETGEPKGPALTHHGSVAAGVISINNLEKRVGGLPDSTIKVDGDRWDEWSEAEQRALLDHELEHLIICRDDEGNVKLDDACRPKLKMRPHDIEMGAFLSVIERHKEDALEWQVFKDAHRQLTQRYLFPMG